MKQVKVVTRVEDSPRDPFVHIITRTEIRKLKLTLIQIYALQKQGEHP